MTFFLFWSRAPKDSWLEDSDVPIILGDGAPPLTKHRKISYNCMGVDFENVIAAIKSNGIVDTGFKHSKVRLEFMRDVTDDIERYYGDPRWGPKS